MGRHVRNLNRICLCSDSLSKICSRGPLLSEHSRQRSVNAVKLRSSGSVIAKHLMSRSRRQELSMYTAVSYGWREIRSCRREASGHRVLRGGTGSARPLRPRPGPPPRPHGRRTQPPRGWQENACQFSYYECN